MKKGDCIHMRCPGNPIPHLWVVASDIDSVGRCVIVNVTTLAHICDKTVILHKGDHQSIEHDSIVRYQDAMITTDKAIEAAIRGGAALRKTPCSQATLKKIIEGIAKSPETPLDIQAFCGVPVSTTLPDKSKKK
jgi:hypothetical protein